MDVHFTGARVKEFRKWWLPEESLVQKMERLFFSSHLDELVKAGEKVGLKIHMGEPGNVHYLRPIYASKLVDVLGELGASVIVVETSGLGTIPGRTSTAKHLEAARRNGFSEETIGAPLVMVDGENGLDYLNNNGIAVAKGIADLDSLIVLSHATGHIQAGFGGALKNLGVGCVAKPGKYRVHYEDKPKIDKICDACGVCISICPVGAISGEPLEIGGGCIACGACLDSCKRRAIKAKFNTGDMLSERIAENAAAVIKTLGGKVGYLNLLMDIIPHCDCHPHSDIPVVPDIGLLASLDPVAIDQASIDLVNSSNGIPSSEADGVGAMQDKFKFINPGTDYHVQLKIAEELGVGKREYTIRD